MLDPERYQTHRVQRWHPLLYITWGLPWLPIPDSHVLPGPFLRIFAGLWLGTGKKLRPKQSALRLCLSLKSLNNSTCIPLIIGMMVPVGK